MSVDRRSSARGEEQTRWNQVDDSERSPRRVRSSAWSTLIEDTVPLLDDTAQIEAEEREARWGVVTGQRRKRLRTGAIRFQQD